MSERVLDAPVVPRPATGASPPAGHERPRRPRLGLGHLDLALILVGLGVLFVLPVVAPRPQWHPGMLFWHDGWERYRLLNRFVHGTPVSELRNVHRHWSDRWPYLPTFAALPLWYLGELVKTPSWWIARFNWFVTAGALAVLWLGLRRRVDTGLLQSFFLLLLGASMLPGHLAAFFPLEVFSALLVGSGIILVGAGWPLVGWAAVVIGTASIPATLPALMLVVAVAMLTRRWLRLLVVPAAAGLLICADQWVRNGTFGLGYASTDRGAHSVLPYSTHPGFSYPLGFGLLAVLFSAGKGLVFFAPGLLVPARRVLSATHRGLWRSQLLLLCFVAGLVVTFARWWGWDGGFFWGPRFFLVASVPACLALAAGLRHPPRSVAGKLAVLGVLVLSVWVAIDGAVFGLSGLQICDTALHGNTTYLCDSVPEFSVLWHPFVGGLHVTGGRHIAYLLFALAVLVRLAGPLLAQTLRQTALGWPPAWRPGRLLAGWHL